MRVALVGAEFEENLAIRYLWGALEAAGHTVVQIVFNAPDELERAAGELAASGTEVAGFSMVFTLRAREFADLATRARELGYRGHLIAGGHFAAFHAERILTDVPAFDSIACGEGEETLCQLCAAPAALDAVPGLVWRRGRELVRNPQAVKPPDLDVLPLPPRKVPFDRYLGLPITNLLGSRGCLHGCSFCSIVAWHKLTGGARLRLRAPEHIADEMAGLYRQGVRIFNFHDDNFFLPRTEDTRARMEALAAALAARGVGRIAFAVKSRPDTVDEGLFAYLKSMGLFRVFLGIEAGTAESLSRLGRGQTLDDNERALAVVNRLELHACFNLLLLNPESTLEDLATNVAFLRAHPANPMNFCRTEIYTGTPLERKLGREGRLLGDYWGWDYLIRDPRAEAAFEVIYPAFRARNYGDAADQGIHHLAMQVDYELTLAAHFFGVRANLRRRVKQLIVQINLDTCDHLEDAIRAIGQGLAGEPRVAFTEALRQRVEADNRRLGAAGRALLREIRAGAHERPGARVWARRAAAGAGLAASMALAACEKKPTASHMTETVAAPPSPDAAPAVPPLGPAELLTGPFRDAARAVLMERIQPPQDVEVELWLDGRGQVTRAILRKPALEPARQAALETELRKLSFAIADATGKRFVVTYPASMLEPPTQMTEMIAQPPPKHPHPPSHPSEKIPSPHRKP